jgi:hypothetical protein
VRATELEMLACFGVEPRLLDTRDPWCYNEATYTVEVDGLSVSFTVAPSYQDVRLIVQRGDEDVFELNAVGVVDVRVIDQPGVDAVEVVFTHKSCLKLQLRPTFEITQSFEAAGRTIRRRRLGTH